MKFKKITIFVINARKKECNFMTGGLTLGFAIHLVVSVTACKCEHCRASLESSVHLESRVLLDLLDFPDTMLFQPHLDRW